MDDLRRLLASRRHVELVEYDIQPPASLKVVFLVYPSTENDHLPEWKRVIVFDAPTHIAFSNVVIPHNRLQTVQTVPHAAGGFWAEFCFCDGSRLEFRFSKEWGPCECREQPATHHE